MDPGAAELTYGCLSFSATKARTERHKVTDSQDDGFADTEGSLTSRGRWSMEICTINSIVIPTAA
jgi:hypothetical protein